jgi:hypothetical protein
VKIICIRAEAKGFDTPHRRYGLYVFGDELPREIVAAAFPSSVPEFPAVEIAAPVFAVLRILAAGMGGGANHRQDGA